MKSNKEKDPYIYKRLQPTNEDEDDFEDAEITEDLFEDKYDINQFKKIPWKGIILSIFLFVTGSTLLVFGILILTDYIKSAEHSQGLYIFLTIIIIKIIICFYYCYYQE